MEILLVEKKCSPTIIPGFKVLLVSCCTYHSAFITVNNDLYIFGSNEYGKLGYADFRINLNTPTIVEGFKVTSVKCIEDNTLFITTDNDVYTIGENNLGQCGLGHGEHVVKPTKIPDFKHFNPDNIRFKKTKSARN